MTPAAASLESLAALGSAVGNLLKERKQTLAAAESSAGGLINAALVAVPGASAYSASLVPEQRHCMPTASQSFGRAGFTECDSD